jgi:hypothetical protein
MFFGSSRVRDGRHAAPESERLVEHARGLGVAADDRLPQALLVQPLEAERADGGPESAAAKFRARADRHEERDGVPVVRPDEDGRRKKPSVKTPVQFSGANK